MVDEALRMGAHPDDRDGVTDMTLLMYVYLCIYKIYILFFFIFLHLRYTCKAGAAGVGDGSMASKVNKKFFYINLFMYFNMLLNRYIFFRWLKG